MSTKEICIKYTVSEKYILICLFFFFKFKNFFNNFYLIFYSLIKTLMNHSKLVGDMGYLLTQLEMAYNYITSITYLSLNVTLEEFEKNWNIFDAKD